MKLFKKLLLLLLFITTISINTSAQEMEFTTDKKLHYIGSAFTSTFLLVLSNGRTNDLNKSIKIATFTTIAIGGFKEVVIDNMMGMGNPSVADMTYNVLGTLTGVVVVGSIIWVSNKIKTKNNPLQL